MMAITLRNPPALWVKLGWKTIETRSRPTSYRGPLLITAGKRWVDWPTTCPDLGVCHHRGICTSTRGCYRLSCCGPLSAAGWGDSWPEMPAGETVAVVDLVDCVEIVHVAGHTELPHGCVIVTPTAKHARYFPSRTRDGVSILARDVSSQLPMGDFRSGMWAYIFENMRRVRPTPISGRQGTPLWDAGEVELLDA
jgi:hypothetical protein